MRQAIGIDVGGTGIRGARISRLGEILDHRIEATANSSQTVLQQIDRLIAALDRPEVEAIGIGVPSRVNHYTARVFPGGFVDLSGPPLATRLNGTRGRPVDCDNDANSALVAEARVGAAQGSKHVVMLTLGTGIGGAALLNGKIVRGKASAGQLGHIAVVQSDLVCPCGRKGCLETLSSGTALGRHIIKAGLPPATRAEDLLASKDPVAQAVIAKWIGPLRAGIDSLVASFDPEIVVLGGGLGQFACEALTAFPPGSSWFQAAVVPASLGSKAGVIGAALAAMDRVP
jgi:glucokinase